MCGAECWTDHRLILSKLNVRIQPARRPQGKKTLKRLAVNKLKSTETMQLLADSLDKQLETTTLDSLDVETAWSTLQKITYSIASECLGPSTHQHKDWFDENCSEISKLLEDKQRAHKAHLDDPSSAAKKQAFNLICKTIQQRLRQMQDTWLSKKADEIQSYASTVV